MFVVDFMNTLYSVAAVWRPGGRKSRQPLRFCKYFNRCVNAAGYIYFRVEPSITHHGLSPINYFIIQISIISRFHRGTKLWLTNYCCYTLKINRINSLYSLYSEYKLFILWSWNLGICYNSQRKNEKAIRNILFIKRTFVSDDVGVVFQFIGALNKRHECRLSHLILNFLSRIPHISHFIRLIIGYH